MHNSLKILLIEDDTIEVMKLNRVVDSLVVRHKIIETNNGEEALEVLRQKEVLPDIILLDLNMPKINGIEFLATIKNNEALRHIPCIILTTSKNPRDLKSCFELGVAGYVLKPLKYEAYVSKIKALLEYWGMNELIH